MTDFESNVNKIVCGDCLEVMKDWPDNCVDLVLTDPPYGSGGRDGAVHLNDPQIKGNRISSETLIWFTRQYAAMFYRVTKDYAHCYIFSDWRKYQIVKIATESVGWECRALIIWSKGNGMGEYWRSTHEFILFLTKQKTRKLQRGDCFNVLAYPPIRGKKKLHPVEKPVALLRDLITASSCGDEIILDPFCGSGSFKEAAELESRRYIGIDISEKYCEIARMRLKAVETGISVAEQQAGQLALF